MEEKLLEHINLQRPPLLFSIAAGAALILSAAQLTLTNGAQAFTPHTGQTVYSPIKLPAPAPKGVKPKRNPFLAPLAAEVKRNAPPPQPILKGIVQNGNAIMAIIEHNGQSGYYQTGDKTDGFTVQSVSTNGAVLTCNGTKLTLASGGQRQ